jgi:signal transduction histidine kinase
MLRSGLPVWVDFSLSVTVLASVPAYVPAADRLGTWTMWAYAVTLSAAILLAGALDRPALALTGSVVLAGVYLAVVAPPQAGGVAARATAVADAAAFLGFGLLTLVVARFMRNLGSAADTARMRVAELEQEHSRAVVHDLLVYLRLDRFAEADEKTRGAMIAQARAKHLQMRSYVDGTGKLGDLGECVNEALQLHPSLPVKLISETEPGVELAEDVLVQLGRALDTALANVEQHAGSANVTVSLRSAPQHVVVTVCDDGPGFDRHSRPQGFGIREILGRQLEAVGGRGEVHSARGGGTQVRITVPREGPAQ